MNTVRPVVFVIASLFLAASSTSAQGPLTPPGPPAATMKTLNQTEPRTPISTLPFTISSSGSYYLTENLHFTEASGDAITVTASNVTIDLMGFTLSSAAEVTGNAININGDGCTVKNGSILGTTTVEITGSGAGKTWTVTPGGFARAVSSTSGNGHRGLDLTAAKCRQTAIGFFENNGVLSRCIAYQNGGDGLNGGVISDSSAFQNGGAGIDAGQNLGGIVTSSRSYDNKGLGIFGNLVQNCESQNNGGVGINAIKVTDSIASFNVGNGIEAGAVTGSSARGNGGDGIRGAFIKDNQCSTNGGAGVRISSDGGRIEGNNCYNNTFGIQSTGGTNGFIVRNSCRSNGGTPTNAPPATGDFDFDRGTNTYGPVIQVNGDMSAEAAASHPAANIQY